MPKYYRDIKLQIEVLNSIEPEIEKLMNQHLSKRELWFSSDYIPSSDAPETDDVLKKLRATAKHIPDNVRVSIALNLLTEEGLPHFHRILSEAFKNDSIWSKWSFIWTAEEDRHGNVLRDYSRETRIFDFGKLEQRQFEFLLNGYAPHWQGDPYKTLVYTSAQERATQISHESTSKAVKEIEPLLGMLLKKISTEEARHFFFYMNAYKEILKKDINQGLASAYDVLSRFDMPGIEIPGFTEIAEIVMRSGIYSLDDYKIILDVLIAQWKVEAMTGLNEIGRKAQEKMMNLPKRTAKIADYLKSKIKSKTFSMDFLTSRSFKF